MLELGVEFLALHAKNFGERFAFVRVLSLAELGTRVNIIEGGNFLNVRLSNFVDDLFLLFSEYSWVDDWLCLRYRLWIRGGHLYRCGFRWVLFLLLSFPF